METPDEIAEKNIAGIGRSQISRGVKGEKKSPRERRGM